MKILNEIDYYLSKLVSNSYELTYRTDELVIKNINDYQTYINYINDIKNDYLIIICSKDTPGNFLKNELTALGIMDLSKNFQLSYAAILDEGVNIFEKISKDRLDVNDYISYDGSVDGINISILSKGYLIGNISKIIIDNVEYSRNVRGLNFVIYNKRLKKCIDSVGFDLHIPEKICYRNKKTIILNRSIDSLNEKTSESHKIIKNINKTQQEIFFNALKKENEELLDTKKKFFFSLPKNERLKDVHEGILFIMRVIDDICRKNDISYWVSAGNLLGAVRHNGQIPWDDDFDIAMPRDDFYKFCDIVDNKEAYPDFFINRYCHSKGDKYDGFFYRVEIGDAQLNGKRYFVDIWPCCYIDKINDETKKQYNIIKKNFKEKMMSTVRQKWDAIRNNSVAFNEQWREELKEIDEIHDSQLHISDNPESLILSATVWWEGISSYNVKDVFPLVDTEYDGIKLKMPNNPLARLNNGHFDDIYSMPNDILTHSVHIKPDENNKKIMNEYMEKTKKKMGWE